MTTSLYVLIAFAAWSVFLVLCVGAWRVTLVLTRQKPPKAFTAGVPHGTECYWRLNRAHLNAVENLPIVASVILTATIAGRVTPYFERLAVILFAGRVLQSAAHVASGTNMGVNFRFTGYVMQIAS